jgi:N-acetyl-anhydromuramyl-L-alanine amidase AmpD
MWIRVSLELWRRRLKYRQRKVDYYRGKAKSGDGGATPGVVTAKEAALIHKWEGLRDQAKAMVKRREMQLAGEPPHDTRISPNQSSRNGVKPRVIVLHSTEGNYEGSIAWLCNRASQASAHVVVASDGRATRLVEDNRKAWHVAADNAYTLGIEQEGYAGQQAWPEVQIEATARWIAYWARKYDIPITSSVSCGVCRHSDLGAAGGGHHDPGRAYPFDRVLALARAY